MEHASEVARVRRQIELEYQAAARGLCGTAITASHDFINTRYDRLGEHLDRLCEHMTQDAAMQIIIEIGDTAIDQARMHTKSE